MKKILPYLENNIQWIAMALGLALVGYMAWTYVIQNPAKIEAVAGQPDSKVGPGSVDDYVDANYAVKLKATLDGSGNLNLPPYQSMAQEPTAKLYPLSRPGPRDTTIAMEGRKWDSTTVNLANIGPSPSSEEKIMVQALPVTPPLSYLDTEFLRTVVYQPDPTGQWVHADKDSVTTFWAIPAAKLMAEYQRTLGTKIDPVNQQTVPLDAVLIRQEQSASGAWGQDQVVPCVSPGASAPPAAWPPPLAAEQAYKFWAQTNATTILAPAFYNIAFINRPVLAWLPYDQYEAAKNAPPAPAGPAAATAAPPLAPVAAPRPAAPAAPALAPLPNGMFVAANGKLTQDMLVWLIDDSVVPGRTYRYKVIYTLYNPVYGQTERVAKPEFASQFGITSDESGWSEPVTVPPRTRFWVAPGGRQPVMAQARQHQQMIFDVYTWHDGLWRYQPFNEEPGDEIGSNTPDADFTSHWTYLDLTYDNGGAAKTGMVIHDNTGALSARDIGQDESGSEYKQFSTDFSAQPATPGDPAPPPNPAPAAAASAAPGNGG